MLIQIKLINGEPMGRPVNPWEETKFSGGTACGIQYDQFEQLVTYHPAPGCSESDGVEGDLIEQIEVYTNEWVDQIDAPFPVPMNAKTRLIWRLSPSQKVEVKEVYNITICKQNDGGYIVRYDKYPESGGVYSGGLDGAIKFICAYYKYPLEYLIEDLSHKTMNKSYYLQGRYWKTLIARKFLQIIGAPEYRYIWYKRRLWLIKNDPDF